MKVGPPIALKPRRPLRTTSIALPHDSSYGQQWQSWMRFSDKTNPYYYGGPSQCLTTKRAALTWTLSAEDLTPILKPALASGTAATTQQSTFLQADLLLTCERAMATMDIQYRGRSEWRAGVGSAGPFVDERWRGRLQSRTP